MASEREESEGETERQNHQQLIKGFDLINTNYIFFLSFAFLVRPD